MQYAMSSIFPVRLRASQLILTAMQALEISCFDASYALNLSGQGFLGAQESPGTVEEAEFFWSEEFLQCPAPCEPIGAFKASYPRLRNFLCLLVFFFGLELILYS